MLHAGIMSSPQTERARSQEPRTSLGAPGIGLAVAWAVVAAALVAMLLQGVRETDRYDEVRQLLRVAYAAVLLWYLARTGRPVSELPEAGAQLLPRWRHGAWLPVVGIALLFALIVLSEDGLDFLLLTLIIATVWCLVAWRREIRLRAVVQGLALALFAYLAGLPAARHGLLSESASILLPSLTAPMYLAGGLLVARTRLGGAQLLAGRYGGAAASLLRGALLFVPLGLLNAADGSPEGEVGWVSEWWMPLSLPWFSGISEEVLFRLFLVGLGYFLLRPALREQPGAAVVAALLLSGIVFGLAHGRTVDALLTTGLIYGLPMATVFARRDWEHAVGAHYMVNFVPWLMAFLES